MDIASNNTSNMELSDVGQPPHLPSDATYSNSPVSLHFGLHFDPNRFCGDIVAETVQSFQESLKEKDNSERAHHKLSTLIARNQIPASLKVGIKLSLPQNTPGLGNIEEKFRTLTDAYQHAVTTLVMEGRTAIMNQNTNLHSVDTHIGTATINLHNYWRRTNVVPEHLLHSMSNPIMTSLRQQLNVIQLDHAIKADKERAKLNQQLQAMEMEQEEALSNPPESTAAFINKKVKEGIASALSSLQQPWQKPPAQGQPVSNRRRRQQRQQKPPTTSSGSPNTSVVNGGKTGTKSRN